MSSRIFFEENRLRQDPYQPHDDFAPEGNGGGWPKGTWFQNRHQQQDDFAPQSNGSGWPKNTWFQNRLRYVREQQRKKGADDVVYECPLGTITVRQSNGGN
ncbi:MAG: hypothetical protein E6J89_03450 [Deltaproteobacteria bacterium]|nr:MAG: hypothetical protein E6J89_03450 [Deltaproteobacteria bacterium]